MEDYRKIAIELGQTLISKAPETRKDVERMLPELRESEDEKIRKRIIQALHGDVLDMEETAKAISWLENQGEQKSAWSEEDIKIKDIIMHSLIYNIQLKVDDILDINDWFNSLKDRVQVLKYRKENML